MDRVEFGRRAFLRGSAVASGTLLAGVVSGSSSDTVEIVTARGANGPVQTAEVPHRWVAEFNIAKNVRDALENTHLSRSGVLSIGIGFRDQRIGGLRRPRVEIGLSSPALSSLSLPDAVDGIPVDTTVESGEIDWHCYSGSYSGLRGGITGETNYAGGSFGGRIYDRDSDVYSMITARHITLSSRDGCDPTDVVGRAVYQNGDYVGEITESHQKHDIVRVRVSDTDNYTTAAIVDQSGAIGGALTQNGIVYAGSHDQTIHGRGTSTCHLSSTIRLYDVTIDCDTYASSANLSDLVTYTTDPSDFGDSGGPMYDIDESSSTTGPKLLFANTISGAKNRGGEPRLFGPAAYALRAQYNWTFDTDSSV